MKKILHLALFLGLISAIAGGALSAVNSVTAPIITANALKAEQSNLEKLYPGAEFVPMDLNDAPETITKAFEVVGEGVVYKCENQGFKEPIIFLIGTPTTVRSPVIRYWRTMILLVSVHVLMMLSSQMVLLVNQLIRQSIH